MSSLMPLLTKAGPWLIKQLPKLWPMLLDAKNRERVMEAMQNLASRSPGRRLKAKVDLTAVIAERTAQDAVSEAERARAMEWSRRARNLSLRLDMPTADRQLRRSQTRSVEEHLTVLQTEMDEYLSQPGSPSEITPGQDQGGSGVDG